MQGLEQTTTSEDWVTSAEDEKYSVTANAKGEFLSMLAHCWKLFDVRGLDPWTVDGAND